MPLDNVNAPNGFITLASYEPDKVVQRHVAANRAVVGAAASAALAIGDACGIDANGYAFHAGADVAVRGIVVGFVLAPIPTIMNSQGPISQDYLPATDAGDVLLIEDPNVEFLVYTDLFARTDEGGLFNLQDGAPNALFRQSIQALDVSAGAGTQFKALRLDNSPADNAYGNYARAVVKLAQAF